MKKGSIVLAVFVVLMLVIGVSAQAEIGTEENPIKVLFVPSVDANTIVSGGEIMAEALHAATGYYFEVSVPTSFAATVEEMRQPGQYHGIHPCETVRYGQRTLWCGCSICSRPLWL